MPAINCPKVRAALTSDGGADGYVAVADNSDFYPGAIVNIADTAGAAAEFVITDLSGTTKIGLRATGRTDSASGKDGSARYTRGGDLSAWKVANTAAISQERQVVSVENSAFSVKIPKV